jgi:hypothetical protein
MILPDHYVSRTSGLPNVCAFSVSRASCVNFFAPQVSSKRLRLERFRRRWMPGAPEADPEAGQPAWRKDAHVKEYAFLLVAGALYETDSVTFAQALTCSVSYA